ncbi:hypothetical protein T08_4072, partial [Trichinella sp. T8]
LAVPGMPIGSPGMEFGDRKDPYQTIGRFAYYVSNYVGVQLVNS